MFDYFEILNLKKSFKIDKDLLENNYINLCKKFHPDTAENDKQKLEFISKTTDLNNAYKIILNDYSRAIHILELNNIKMDDSTQKNFIDQNFLMDIFEKGEFLETLSEFEELEKLQEKELVEKKILIDKLDDNFEEFNLEEFAILTVKLKYTDNYLINIENKITECF